MSEPVPESTPEPQKPPESKPEKEVKECPEDQHKMVEYKRITEASAVWVYKHCEVCGKEAIPYNEGVPN